MIFELQTILDLRRDAENNAKRSLEVASVKLRSGQEEQARLAARWQAAQAAADAESQRLAQDQTTSTAEQGLAREIYLRRLREEATRLKAAADEHATTALAAAQAAQEAASRTHEAAMRDREVMSKLEQRAKESAQRTTARRAEDEAADLASSRRR